jgi:hypothetical protein
VAAADTTRAIPYAGLPLTDRAGAVTDRYTKAIEQLGSDELDVCVGGIYALERVGSDSPQGSSDGDGSPGRVRPRELPGAAAAAD